jgi:hypothetical protein
VILREDRYPVAGFPSRNALFERAITLLGAASIVQIGRELDRHPAYMSGSILHHASYAVSSSSA